MRVTVVVPTFDRAASLERALAHVLAARIPPGCERAVVVVDNNSTDSTRAVSERLRDRVQYVFEPAQGLSHARNAGIAAARRDGADDGAIVAFTDDDVEVAPDWIEAMTSAFAARPEVECVGGRVLPRWTAAPPSWLTRAHWAPLALQDHGDAARVFDAARPLCLVGANVAFRARVFDRLGGFSPDVQRVRDSIGSTEDHEMLARLYSSGGRALYVPEMIVHAEVPPQRLTRGYHRRWHRGHGGFHARMRLPEIERSRGRIFDVPLHLVRDAANAAASWLPRTIAGDASGAFEREARLWFFGGFVRERCSWLPRR